MLFPNDSVLPSSATYTSLKLKAYTWMGHSCTWGLFLVRLCHKNDYAWRNKYAGSMANTVRLTSSNIHWTSVIRHTIGLRFRIAWSLFRSKAQYIELSFTIMNMLYCIHCVQQSWFFLPKYFQNTLFPPFALSVVSINTQRVPQATDALY